MSFIQYLAFAVAGSAIAYTGFQLGISMFIVYPLIWIGTFAAGSLIITD